MSRRLPFVVASVLIAACGESPMGTPCGGGQYAQARAILPDTGINAGDTLAVGFLQHDTRELAELVIWHMWPFASGVVDPEADPRVRIVRADGLVLLDTIGSRYDQPRNVYDRPTWYVFTWIRDAGRRNALYEGLRDETLWIELSRVGAPAPGTRVRLSTDRVGLHPRSICL